MDKKVLYQPNNTPFVIKKEKEEREA